MSVQNPPKNNPLEAAVSALYHKLLEAWNQHNADAFAALFANDGGVVGFDGSQMNGQEEIASVLGSIFSDHATGVYYGKERSVRLLSPDVALLQAVVGMIPAGQSDLSPNLNAIQTLVATRRAGQWHIVLFQNTPAAYHGRPEAVEALADELRQLLP